MKHLYKFTNVTDLKLKSLSDKKIWFSSLEEFNDPFEGRFKIKNEIKSKEKILEACLNIHFHILKKKSLCNAIYYALKFALLFSVPRRNVITLINNNFSLFVRDLTKMSASCFISSEMESDVLHNKLMWSHYGDGLRGYCLKFNEEKLTTSLFASGSIGRAEVTYVNETPEIDPIHYFCGFSDPFNIGISSKLYLFNVISTKPQEWSYENEVRFLAAKRGSFIFDTTALEGVIIGEKMTFVDRYRVIKCIKGLNKDAKIYEVARRKEKYELFTRVLK